MNTTSSMTIIERTDVLEKSVKDSQHSDNTRLRADLSDIRAAIETAKSGQDEPAKVVAALSRLQEALARFRATVEQVDGSNAELVALVHEAEATLARDVAARSRAIWAFVTEKLRGDTGTYVREIADGASLGPALIDDGLVHLHVKTRPTTGADGGIDDLVGTCGVWLCIGDSCVCTEWECSLDGPSGSFPLTT